MSEASSLKVKSSNGQYDVEIGVGGLERLLDLRPDAALVVDERFLNEPFVAGHGRGAIGIPAVEDQKTLATVERVAVELRRFGITRSDHLVAVGGGIVQDVATLAAHLYMRGLDWSYAPTTLLGMVDSCIGGKSSINAGPFKNLVGSFYPPSVVVVDTDFVSTLPDEALAGGLAEAAKISYCRGPAAFERYLELAEGFPRSAPALSTHSLTTKRWFIETDEFDTGVRRLLNFGHTFGHALEAATGFVLSHGIGVAVGMIAAERFGTMTGAGVADERLTAHAALIASRDPGFARSTSTVDFDVFGEAFASDKKHAPSELHLILPAAGGVPKEVALPRTDENLDAARSAMSEAIETVLS